MSQASITSVYYNAATGKLSLHGSALNSGAVNPSALSLRGDGGLSFTLSGDSVVSGTASAGRVSIQLSAADQLAIDGLLNKNGGLAQDKTAYSLSAIAGWESGATAIAERAVSVNHVHAPKIGHIDYNAASGVFSVSGSYLTEHGLGNGIDLSHFKLTGPNGGSYSFNPTADSVSNFSAGGFSITLSSADQVAVNSIVTGNGAAYRLSATAHWDSDGGAKISALPVNANAYPPVLSSVNFNAAKAELTLSGNNFSAGGGFTLADFSLSGAGGGSYQLTRNSSILSSSLNSVTIKIGLTDLKSLAALLNNNGLQSADGVSYNLAVSAGWDSGGAAIGQTAISVSNVTMPLLSAVTYSSISGLFSFSGANLINHGGAADLSLAHFTVTAGAGSYTFNSSRDSIQLLNTDGSGFVVKLSHADMLAVNAMVSKGIAYDINVSADWYSGIGDGTSINGSIIQTLAATGLNKPQGLAVDSAGNLYAADIDSKSLEEFSAGKHSQTTLLSSGLGHPSAVAVDGAGNVYIADYSGNRILELGAADQAVTTILAKGLSGPAGLAVDSAGNLYVADSFHNTIKEIAVGSHQVTTLLGHGLEFPGGVAVDSAGNVYVTDTWHNAVKEIAAGSRQVTTILGHGLISPEAVAVDGYGNVYVADSGHNLVKEIAAGSHAVSTLLTGSTPLGLTVDGAGNVYVATAPIVNIVGSGTNNITEILHNDYLFNSAPTAEPTPIAAANFWENTAQIELSKSIYSVFAEAGTISAANFSNAAASTSASDYLYYNAANGGLYYAAEGSGGAAVEIAVIGVNSHPAALSLGDFQLIS